MRGGYLFDYNGILEPREMNKSLVPRFLLLIE